MKNTKLLVSTIFIFSIVACSSNEASSSESSNKSSSNVSSSISSRSSVSSQSSVYSSSEVISSSDTISTSDTVSSSQSQSSNPDENVYRQIDESWVNEDVFSKSVNYVLESTLSLSEANDFVDNGFANNYAQASRTKFTTIPWCREHHCVSLCYV